MSRRAKQRTALLELAAKAPTDRELIWAAMRQLKEFSQRDIALLSRCCRSKVQDYLKGLTRAGLVQRLNPEAKLAEEAGYKLLKDTGIEAPRVRKDGTLLPASGRNRMWKVMQVLKVFTEEELVDTASLPEAPIALGEAVTYCRWLARGGYLKARQDGGWKMVPAKYTGVKAPQILRVKKLFDPNLGIVVYEGQQKGSDDE
ncbi:hypothetical protein [Desulfovibrio sp.]|jgi:hypothetical protein|uniref:hypothetical protein n=1 Tax=Desulfovibrio sp. TaxID=885 RepID=UPI00262286C9|nr:hypothetical protein [Desulfovibrio sp.]